MPQFARCLLVYEWGWGFFLLLAIGVIVVVAFVLFWIWFLGLRNPVATEGPTSAGWKDFILRGHPVVLLLVLLVLVGAGYMVYLGYDKFRNSYSVSFENASAPPITLDALRDKYQEETQATIIVTPRAKSFLVSENFDGACVPDLFEAICRHYNDKLSCRSSWTDPTLTVDLK
jgi:hypothetical protein